MKATPISLFLGAMLALHAHAETPIPFRCEGTYSNDDRGITNEPLKFEHVGELPKPGEGYYLWALRAHTSDGEFEVQGDYNDKVNYGTMSIYRTSARVYRGNVRNYTFPAGHAQPEFLELIELDPKDYNHDRGSIHMSCYKL